MYVTASQLKFSLWNWGQEKSKKKKDTLDQRYWEKGAIFNKVQVQTRDQQSYHASQEVPWEYP